MIKFTYLPSVRQHIQLSCWHCCQLQMSVTPLHSTVKLYCYSLLLVMISHTAECCGFGAVKVRKWDVPLKLWPYGTIGIWWLLFLCSREWKSVPSWKLPMTWVTRDPFRVWKVKHLLGGILAQHSLCLTGTLMSNGRLAYCDLQAESSECLFKSSLAGVDCGGDTVAGGRTTDHTACYCWK